MVKYGSIALCVFVFTFLCQFIGINSSVISKEARTVHKDMEIRLTSFQRELSKALVDIDEIRENRGACTCPAPNATVTGKYQFIFYQ